MLQVPRIITNGNIYAVQSTAALKTPPDKQYIEGAVPLRTYRGNRLSNIRQNFIYKPVKVIQQTNIYGQQNKQAAVKPSTTTKQRVNTKRFTKP
jgi:hypothetical protein